MKQPYHNVFMISLYYPTQSLDIKSEKKKRRVTGTNGHPTPWLEKTWCFCYVWMCLMQIKHKLKLEPVINVSRKAKKRQRQLLSSCTIPRLACLHRSFGEFFLAETASEYLKFQEFTLGVTGKSSSAQSALSFPCHVACNIAVAKNRTWFPVGLGLVPTSWSDRDTKRTNSTAANRTNRFCWGVVRSCIETGI